ncbi:MAG: FAD-dependent oxidoreductase [Candidatus Hodarchaeales archaeon]|jgi:NADPH-dependent 2,4-dienoyl-CoA reductase/sulfur reductase-like enzyme/Fe-S-cluster-containing hydrogenase component 2/bacterioferritin-associated ferredoxin
MTNRITEHPILPIPELKGIEFYWEDKLMRGIEGMVISSALFLNGVKVFGLHPKDNSPQGIFCANNQCAQCTVLVNSKPVKACMIPLAEGMNIHSCRSLPELTADDSPVTFGKIAHVETDILVIGAGPAGLSAAQIFGVEGLKVILVDDKDRIGGKLVLQTHKFFGSTQDVYAGKRGIEIAEILDEAVRSFSNIDIWLSSTAIAVFSDKLVGILKENEYILVKPQKLLIATGAREKMLVFPGDTLPGVYGAGAFQTLVNRDLVRSADKIFIVGGGNVGLIAGYHALQAGIDVIGLVEALPHCGGYKVHEDKLRRLGVPIYKSHTILSANGDDKVESITIGKLDSDWNVVQGTEKSFLCDTILIAVGLDPVNEFYNKAIEFGMDVWVAGDAQEIAEASAAIFTGRIEAIKILHSLGIETEEKIQELEEKALIMKALPPKPKTLVTPTQEEGIFPIFHCDQEIPCNPCTSVCPQHQVETENDLITNLPYFKGEKVCTGCGRCVAVCPGLAISLVDYRKDSENPFVTFPHEMVKESVNKGEKVTVMSNVGELGEFIVQRTRKLKEYPRTQLITIMLPRKVAKYAIGIKMQFNEISEPMAIYHKPSLADEAIVCRCERITVGEIRKWIRQGVTDVNQLKALTHVQMGACGGKTCTALINRIFREEGITPDKITQGTKRPLFVEVPLGIFANTKEVKK